MSKKELSGYQKNVVDNYYANLDSICLQRLGEMVTELYLADSDRKKKQLWQRVHKAMLNLKIPPDIITHIMNGQDIEILAKNLNDWQKYKPKIHRGR